MLTIGHSTLSLDTFLKILSANGVQTLVDIRTIPKSRHNPQFAGTALSPALTAASIEYHWMPSLGGLRKPRKAPGNPLTAGWVNPSFRGYADYMQTGDFAAAIDELLTVADPSSTVIMCAEAVPWRCHRSLVGDALTVRGVAVEDIFYDKAGVSRRQPHRLTKFAQVEGTKVWYPAANPG